ncbi:MAG TPA: amidohydrolase family protein [Kofleriaceae bacterium]|nr:amidohydrolase family protein [Kofleriaceae bacterium]
MIRPLRTSPRLVVLLSLVAAQTASCGGAGAGAGKGPGIEVDFVGRWQDPAPDYPELAAARASAEDRRAALRNPGARPIAITGATVLTATGHRFAPGLVVLEGGAISYVGAAGGRAIPRGARMIDGRGKTVTPGLIDVHSHLGVYAVPGVVAAADGNEATAPVTAQARAEYGYWPQDPGITRALAGGVTTALILPGSANLIGGRGFTVALRLGRTAEEVRFPGAPTTIKMACGENPKRVYGEKGVLMTRMAEYAAFRAAFQLAAEYRAKQRTYQRTRAEWDAKRARAAEQEAEAARDGKPGRVKPEPAPEPPPRDLGLETLARVLSGEVMVQIHCYRADEMRALVAVADEYGFRIRSFHHALEAYKIRDLLAEHGIAVSTWSDWWGFKMEAFDGIPENAALITEAGGRATIHSDSAIAIQRLNQDAGKAMFAGRAAGIDISEDDALRWVTANPAWVLGIDDVVGTLEKGKRADVVMWSGSPFSVYSRPDVVIQAGEVAFQRARGLAASDFELANAAPLAGWKTGAGPAALGGAASVAPAAAAASASASGSPAAGFAIEGATIYVTPTEAIRDATLVVQKGRVTAVGKKVAVPSSLRRIDGRGRVVTAGLVDASSAIGLVEVEQEATTTDGRFEDAIPVHAAYRAIDGYDPTSVAIPVARSGGVTSVVTAPSGGLVSGAAAWVTLADRPGEGEGIVKAPVAMYAALGEAATGVTSGSRGLATLRLREVLDDAVQYARRRGNYERNQTRSFAASRLDLEALGPVVRGAEPLVVRANRATDIRAALRLARELRLKVIIEGGTEAWMIADELARARVPVLLNPTQNLPASFERIHVRDDAAAVLAAAGVEVGLTPMGGSTEVRTVRQLAGIAVANGLSHPQALAAVTTVPARAFGVARRGTLERGEVADLVVWTGDPFELSTLAERVVIGGVEQPPGSRQTELRDRYRALVPARRGRPKSPKAAPAAARGGRKAAPAAAPPSSSPR